jgi:hypothetical protein
MTQIRHRSFREEGYMAISRRLKIVPAIFALLLSPFSLRFLALAVSVFLAATNYAHPGV